ncbi:FMN-binding protein [Glaciibacter sp. 2TAF33]|uniref:FMN-binding protein n=1 Tax=Glaciibacter sp. 2TAF33 TaxID=3233015 RepID=UPI003F90EAB5
MRARAVVIASLASVAVIGTGWELGSQVHVSQLALPGTDASGAAPTPGSARSPTTASPQPAATAAPAPAAPATPEPTSSTPATPTPAPDTASGTFTGTAVETRFGTVQVAVTVAGGTISDVSTVQLTSRDGRSASINSRAVPVLRSEVLQAQSANVQNVSGATYTSTGYLTSLQAALDAAGF